jgi:hypothetical protein|tara:strand:- start:573 stop:755 length:183 start_codon:yes stop_codon:yes gene_type:complete
VEIQTTKYYDIEFLEGDEIFTGTDIPANSEEEAINKMMFMFMGKIDQNSELIHIEESRIH